MNYKVVNDNLRGDPRPLKAFEWPKERAKLAQALLAGKTVFIPLVDPQGGQLDEVEPELKAFGQMMYRYEGRSVQRRRASVKAVDGFVVWLGPA